MLGTPLSRGCRSSWVCASASSRGQHRASSMDSPPAGGRTDRLLRSPGQVVGEVVTDGASGGHCCDRSPPR